MRPYDIDAADEPSPENMPSYDRSKPLRPAAVVALFGMVTLCTLVLISWATGWMADTIVRWFP